MSFRPSKLVSTRPRGRPLPRKPVDASFCGSLSLPARILALAQASIQQDLPTLPTQEETPLEDSRKAQEQEKLESNNSHWEEEAAIAEAIAAMQKCSTVDALQQLVDGTDFNTSSGTLLLGYALRQLRQLDQKVNIGWGRQATLKQSGGHGASKKLGQQLCHAANQSMAKMVPRTIANSLHYLNGLACLDKLVLAKASSAVSKKVAEMPTAFKITEIAQICRACQRLRFSNKKMHAALSINIVSLTDAELNPRAALNILSACQKMGFKDAKALRCLMAHLAKNVGLLEVYDLGRVALPAVRNMSKCPTEAGALLNALQYTVCRQKPNSINAMNAAILLRDLATPRILQPEAAQALITIVQREEKIGQSLGSVLEEARPSLEVLGYQVNVQSPFSELHAKGSISKLQTAE